MRKFNCCASIFQKLRQYIFYQYPIRYMIQSYLRLLSIFLTFFLIGSTSEEKFYVLIVYGLLTLLFFLWPIFIIGFVLNNHKRLTSAIFIRKFNALINGIKVTSFSSIVYYAVFSVRRFDLILINQYLSQKSPLSGVERSLYLEKTLLFLVV